MVTGVCIPPLAQTGEVGPGPQEKAENAQIPPYESGERLHGEDETAGHLCLVLNDAWPPVPTFYLLTG